MPYCGWGRDGYAELDLSWFGDKHNERELDRRDADLGGDYVRGGADKYRVYRLFVTADGVNGGEVRVGSTVCG